MKKKKKKKKKTVKVGETKMSGCILKEPSDTHYVSGRVSSKKFGTDSNL